MSSHDDTISRLRKREAELIRSNQILGNAVTSAVARLKSSPGSAAAVADELNAALLEAVKAVKTP